MDPVYKFLQGSKCTIILCSCFMSLDASYFWYIACFPMCIEPVHEKDFVEDRYELYPCLWIFYIILYLEFIQNNIFLVYILGYFITPWIQVVTKMTKIKNVCLLCSSCRAIGPKLCNRKLFFVTLFQIWFLGIRPFWGICENGWNFIINWCGFI